MRTLAVVPARAGSKGIPGKNKRLFAGKPLVQWAIEVGKRTCTRTVVTTDDPDVLEMAQDCGAETIDRPGHLATDDTPMLDVLKHALACQTELPDAVVLLQPTQPLRTDMHVRSALRELAQCKDADSVISVVEIPAHFSPDWAMRIEGGLLQPVVGVPARRQDCRTGYYRDGTVYAYRTELLARGEMYGKAVPLVIRADESCTIDDEADWARAEQMWRQRGTV